MSRRVRLVGPEIGLGRDKDSAIEEFRVARHAVAGTLVEVGRVEAGVDRIGAVGRRRAVGHRRAVDQDKRPVRVVGSGTECCLAEAGGLVVAGRREDSPAVLDCSNFQQTLCSTRRTGCFWFEDKLGEGLRWLFMWKRFWPIAQFGIICIHTRAFFREAVSARDHRSESRLCSSTCVR